MNLKSHFNSEIDCKDEDEDALLSEIDLGKLTSNCQKNSNEGFRLKRPPSSDLTPTIKKETTKSKQQLPGKKQKTTNDNFNPIEKNSNSHTNRVLSPNQNKTNELVREPKRTITPQIQEVDFSSVSKPKYSNYSNNECIEEVFFTNHDQIPSKARSEKNTIRVPDKPEIKLPSNPKVNASKKMESLENLKNPKFLESCCMSNKPQTTSTDPNLASCVHYVRGRFATLTDKLKQFKSKWYQECKIQSLANNKTLVMEAYIG